MRRTAISLSGIGYRVSGIGYRVSDIAYRTSVLPAQLTRRNPGLQLISLHRQGARREIREGARRVVRAIEVEIDDTVHGERSVQEAARLIGLGAAGQVLE